jgi:hypothetical protein
VRRPPYQEQIVIVTALGILLPAAALTFAVRRIGGKPTTAQALGLLLLVFISLGAAIFSTSRVPVPVDEVARGYPYAGVFGPVQALNPLTNDTVKQILPWMDEVRRQLFSGHLPLWNPYAFAGYPLLGNGQSAPFSPFFLATLFVPLPKQLVAMAGLKLFVALLFTFLAAKREGLSDAAAYFAAVAFAFSVFENVYLFYPLTSVTALLPAAVFSVQLCFDAPGIRSAVLTACVGAAVLAGGHPESALHVALAALAFVSVRRVRGVATVLGGALAAIALSAVAWLPVAEEALHSVRLAEIREHARVMTPPFPLETWRALFNPNAFGNPAFGNWRGFGNYSMVAPSYLGIATLVFFCIALIFARRRRTYAFAAIALLAFLVAMNWSPAGRVVNRLPLFSSSANDRLRVLTVFFAALVAGAGVDALRRTGWRYAAVAVCAVELIALNAPFNALAPVRYYKPDLPIIDALHRLQNAAPGRFAGFDWMLMPNASVHYQLEDVRGSDPMAPAAYASFFQLVQADDPSSDVKRIRNIDSPGLDFLNVRYLMTEPDQAPGAPWRLLYSGKDGRLYENPRALPRFFAPEIAEPFDRSRPLLDQLRGIPDFRQRVIATHLHTNGEAGVIAIEHRPTWWTITTEAAQPVFVASSISNTPGWRASIDANRIPLETVNGAFVGFTVPAGKRTVQLRYEPRSVVVGAVVSTAALLLLAGLWSASFTTASSPVRDATPS